MNKPIDVIEAANRTRRERRGYSLSIQEWQRGEADPSGWTAKIFDPVVVLKPDRVFLDVTSRIDSFVKIEAGEGVCIGQRVHVASFAHIGIGGGVVLLEDGSAVASGAKIVSGSNVPGYGHGCSAVDPAAKIYKSFAWIQEDATLFAGAIVLPGVTIGVNACLAAGAVATKDVPPFEIWGGVPARKIGEIDP